MPFTGSHPAAVLPLMRLGLVPAALVIGSMVPDLPYYVPIPIDFDFTHTLLGVVSVDLVLGLAAFAVWQALLAPVAMALAPAGVRRRMPPAWPVPWRALIAGRRAVSLVAVSLTAGAATHVLWDAFTHEGRWGARHIGWLAARQGDLTGYRWAQYASGLVGLLVIAAAAWVWWRRDPWERAASAGRAEALAMRPDGAEEDGFDVDRLGVDGYPQRIPSLGPRATWTVAVAVAAAACVAGVAGFAVAASRGEVMSRELYRAATWGGAAGLLVALIAAVWCARLLRQRGVRG
jgi:hypothetical protein